MFAPRGHTIGILDYGVGNLYSIQKALREFTNNVLITDDPEKIKELDGLILPGVGSFGAGMDGLHRRGLIKEVKNFAKSGKPMLGICLGAQIMLSKGYEFGEFKGLDIIPGRVVIFPKLKGGAKIPNIGWSEFYYKKGFSPNKTIFDSVGKNSDAYFVHSFVLEPKNKDHVATLTDYGGYTFCSAIRKDNIYGCQFHPEKSGPIGLKIIENFVKLTKIK